MRRLLPFLPLFLLGCGGQGDAIRSLSITPRVATLRPGESKTFAFDSYLVNHGHIEFEMLDKPEGTTFEPSGMWEQGTVHFVLTASNDPGTYRIRGAVVDEDTGQIDEAFATVTILP